jgi:hypothetical protein
MNKVYFVYQELTYQSISEYTLSGPDDVDSIVLVLLWFTCWVKEVESYDNKLLEERQ